MSLRKYVCNLCSLLKVFWAATGNLGSDYLYMVLYMSGIWDNVTESNCENPLKLMLKLIGSGVHE